MSNLYLVTSAIEAGVGTTESRLEQTKKTIKSIEKHDPGSKIILVESTCTPKIEGCSIIDLSNHKMVKKCLDIVSLQPNPTSWPESKFRAGFLKNTLESAMMSHVLLHLDLSRFKTVFKLSGRYELNDDFDARNHNSVSIKSLSESWGAEMTSFSNRTMMPLYSFDSCLQEYMTDVLIKCHKYIVNQPQKDKVGDLEHAIPGFVDEKLLNQIDVLGVEGMENNTNKIKI